MAFKSRIFSKGEIIEDKYRIEGELAKGGMSRIYIATFLENGEKVVLKQPKPDNDSRHDLYCKSIRHEANMLSRLNHPQVVGFIDFIHKHNILVMKYIEGCSLSEHYECKKATPEEALSLALKISEALAHLHSMDIVHRDICPRNIIVDSKREPHLIDFGTAFDINLGDSVASNVSHGPYTSPELSDKKVKLDPAALKACDIYSLGATLYFILSMTSPPALQDGTPCMSLRGNDLFDNLIVRTTQWKPGLRMTLPEINGELRKIESIVRYKPVLKIVKSNDQSVKSGTLFFLDNAKNRIGTSPSSDVHIPARFITTPHAEISNHGNSWHIHDCNSTNGTFVNRTRVTPYEKRELRDGDHIWLVYNPNNSKEPYIELEFVSKKERIEKYYEELNNLDIQTSWDWEGKEFHMRTRVKNNSKMAWKNVKVDYTSMEENFKCERLKEFPFNVEPDHERYYEIKMNLVDEAVGGDFVYPMKVFIGGRLIREDNIHIRYGESFRPSTGLKVESAKRLDEGKITVNMKLHNTSPYTYNRVCVGLNIPDGLELMHQDNMQRNIPTIGSNEEHLITYQLRPKKKMKATIHFDISYLDHLGSKKQVNVEGIQTGEIMPLIEPLEMDPKRFFQECDRLARASRQTMYRDIALQKARNRISQTCQNLFAVVENKDGDSFQLFYSGKPTKGKGKPFLLLCGAWAREDKSIELRMDAYSSNEEEADEFLQEQFESVDRAFRVENAVLVTQVTNIVNVKDSVIYKSNIGEKGKTQFNLEDGVAFKTE